jgi:hypothetical protein
MTDDFEPVRPTSRIDTHEVLDWTDDDIRTEEERAWPVGKPFSRVDEMRLVEPGPVPTLVLTLIPVPSMGAVDRTTLAGDIRLLRYALDEYDRSLGGNGFTLIGTEPSTDSVTLTLVPLVVENAADRLKQIIAQIDANDSAARIDFAGDESPASGLVLVRPRFSEVHAEIAFPSTV